MAGVDPLALPIALNLIAVGAFAVSGAYEAIRRGYDVVGIAALAMVTAVGGALMRDLLLGDTPPPLLRDWRFLVAIGVGAIGAMPFGKLISRLPPLTAPLLLFDALGLAIFAIVGAEKALAFGVAWPGAIFIGVLNGVGGSIVRDVLTRQEPLLFKPAQYYALAAMAGTGLFVGLHVFLFPVGAAAACGIVTIALIRLAAVRFNWRTHAAVDLEARETVMVSGRR